MSLLVYRLVVLMYSTDVFEQKIRAWFTKAELTVLELNLNVLV